ncbi:MAG: NmrA family NAD(P)-binding protein, partial [Acidobacteriota bacterium]|nr:NmrA family NAD(P)-binding protein [Acidobacteriota bacterium]
INLVDAVAEAGVGHFVFSTLPPVERATGGRLRSPHFDLKARMEEHARSLGLPATFVHAAYYFDNFLYFFVPQRQEDGSYHFGFPQGDTPLAAMSVSDVGAIVAQIFEQPENYLGKVVKLAGDELPPAEYAAIMSRVSGANIRYAYIPREVFASFGFPGAADLADMFEYYRTVMPSRAEEVEKCRALAPELQSFATWAERNAAALRGSLESSAA